MPDLAGPFDASTFAQAQFYRDRGYLEPSGVQGAPAVVTTAGDLPLTAAGFALTLGLGRAHVRGAAYERTGSAWTYTVPANTGTVGPRNDLLVLRRDLVAKTVVPTYLQGTPAATPADPAMTQAEDGTWDLPLYRVQAPISSGTPLVVTDLRTYLGWVPARLTLDAAFRNFIDFSSPPPYERLHITAHGTDVRIRGLITPTGTVGSGTYARVAAIPGGLVPPARIIRHTFHAATSTRHRLDVVPFGDTSTGAGQAGALVLGPANGSIGNTDYLNVDLSYSLLNGV